MKRIFLIILCPLLAGCTASLLTIDSAETPSDLPAKVLLDVPFTSQAPFANWDDPYQEACEEASLIMVHHYLKKTDITKEEADTEILALVQWEEGHGYPQDVTLEQLAEIAEEYYGYTTTLTGAVTIDAIKRELASGNPVILPAAGRELGNPYFSGEGPWYHMLVVRGYDRKRFITNDPGTRRGKEYKYDYDVLLNAVHDWTGIKEETGQGKKVMLVLQQRNL